MEADAQPASKPSPEREWWLRALAVFQSPRAVFAALRNDAKEQAEARQEPVLALVILAGIAGSLASPSMGKLLDDPGIDGALVPILAFLAGGMYGFATYWLGGAALHFGARGAGSTASYRQARHLLAFAAAPVALSLFLVWPVKLAVYGDDLFRAGGGDESGLDRWLFSGLEAAIALWSLALLVVGLRVVNRWSVPRALGALGITLFVLLGATLVIVIVLPR